MLGSKNRFKSVGFSGRERCLYLVCNKSFILSPENCAKLMIWNTRGENISNYIIVWFHQKTGIANFSAFYIKDSITHIISQLFLHSSRNKKSRRDRMQSLWWIAELQSGSFSCNFLRQKATKIKWQMIDYNV